jgi:hypothetical protein
MVKKVLFFGNCQPEAIMKCLNLNKSYITYYEGCHLSTLNKKEFTTLIKEQDIIITQHISSNYRNLDYLNTQYILNNTNGIVIIFNSCYFKFYYPDLKYISYNNERLRIPIDYHYQYMIDNYKRGDTIQNYIDNYVNNPNLISEKSLLELATESINELKKRDTEMRKNLCTKSNVYFISITDYIKNNYKEKLLFYSMNHPSKYLLQFICENIINILNIDNSINYTIDPLNYPKCILYKCLESTVRFKISNDNISTRDTFSITKQYYDTYDKINFKNNKIT